MAIRLVTAGVTDLRLPTPAAKPDFTAARTIAGQSGQVRGNWQAFFVRIPSSGFADNRVYNVLGFDQGGTGTFSLGVDQRIRIGGDSAGSATLSGAGRLRPWVTRRGGGVLAYGTAENDGAMTALPLMTRDPDVYLVVEGIRNVGTTGSPDWRGFAAICPVGGAAASEVRASVNAGALSGAGTILGQIFVSQDTSVARHTPPNLVLEHYGLVEGDFPWDTVNNRPHHDAIAALAAGSGAATLYDYAELATAQNAGTLPFSNCDQGLGEVRLWYPLTDLTAGGLANLGTAGTNTLVVTNHNSGSGGLTDLTPGIAPAHWSAAASPPVITDPGIKFFGGRGTRAISIAGTHSGNVQRRWETMAGAVLAGFDWATVTTTGGAFTITDTLPVGGPYRLRVRDAADNANTASPLEDVLVGTVLVTHGQSGMELAFGASTPVLGVNNLSLAVDAGAQGLLVKLQNQLGGTTATYAQPTITSARLIGGQTPAVRSGVVAAMNQWHAVNPGHPLCIVNMAINGTGMAEWAANDDTTFRGGHASWRFLGTIGAVAGASSGNDSGVVETYAAALGRWADVHAIMWTPGMSSVQATRDSYAAGIDARWSANASVPWLVLPVWRGHRDPPDSSITVPKREEHVLFVAERGARGFLGPCWGDVVMDLNGTLHAAFSATVPALDTNQVGVTRIGRGVARAAARVFNPAINTTFRIVGAWWPAAAGSNTIEVELGRPARTLAGAAVRADMFWVSEDNGATFTNIGFTVALAAGGTRAVLTKSSGNWAATNVRVDYMRNFPNPPAITPNEADTEPLLNGLLYDAGTWRGRVDLTTPAGNVLQGTNRTGAGVAGIPVEARGPARLLTTELFEGVRTITVRMMAADGVTVLAEKEVTVNAASPFEQGPTVTVAAGDDLYAAMLAAEPGTRLNVDSRAPINLNIGGIVKDDPGILVVFDPAQIWMLRHTSACSNVHIRRGIAEADTVLGTVVPSNYSIRLTTGASKISVEGAIIRHSAQLAVIENCSDVRMKNLVMQYGRADCFTGSNMQRVEVSHIEANRAVTGWTTAYASDGRPAVYGISSSAAATDGRRWRDSAHADFLQFRLNPRDIIVRYCTFDFDGAGIVNFGTGGDDNTWKRFVIEHNYCLTIGNPIRVEGTDGRVNDNTIGRSPTHEPNIRNVLTAVAAPVGSPIRAGRNELLGDSIFSTLNPPGVDFGALEINGPAITEPEAPRIVTPEWWPEFARPADDPLDEAPQNITAPFLLWFGGPLDLVEPNILPVPTLGTALTIARGGWRSLLRSAPFEYRWLRGGVEISSATASAYVLTGDDMGQPIVGQARGQGPDGRWGDWASTAAVTPA